MKTQSGWGQGGGEFMDTTWSSWEERRDKMYWVNYFRMNMSSASCDWFIDWFWRRMELFAGYTFIKKIFLIQNVGSDLVTTGALLQKFILNFALGKIQWQISHTYLCSKFVKCIKTFIKFPWKGQCHRCACQEPKCAFFVDYIAIIHLWGIKQKMFTRNAFKFVLRWTQEELMCNCLYQLFPSATTNDYDTSRKSNQQTHNSSFSPCFLGIVILTYACFDNAPCKLRFHGSIA